MNIYKLLKTDHDKVKGILGKIETSPNKSEQKKLLHTLITELFNHNQAEEQAFYKSLERYPEIKETIKHYEDEHEEAENYLIHLDSLDSKSREWDNMIKAMKESILHNVDQEENELFPKSKELILNGQLDKMGEEFHSIKEEIEKNPL